MPRLKGPRCKHVRVNGTRCECPALREQAYCYFHYRARQREQAAQVPQKAGGQEPDALKSKPQEPVAVGGQALTGEGLAALCPPPDLFLLEDANAIQCAVEWVLRRILEGTLEHRRAALLLHGLQIASANIKLTNFRPLPKELIKSSSQFSVLSSQSRAGTVGSGQ